MLKGRAWQIGVLGVALSPETIGANLCAVHQHPEAVKGCPPKVGSTWAAWHSQIPKCGVWFESRSRGKVQSCSQIKPPGGKNESCQISCRGLIADNQNYQLSAAW